MKREARAQVQDLTEANSKLGRGQGRATALCVAVVESRGWSCMSLRLCMFGMGRTGLPHTLLGDHQASQCPGFKS